MTIKQKKFFNALPNSSSYAEAARKAGYSEKSCRVSASKNITKYNTFFVDVLDSADVNFDSLGKMIKKGLNSRDQRMKFQYLKLVLNMADKISPKEEEHLSLTLGEIAKEKLKMLNVSQYD